MGARAIVSIELLLDSSAEERVRAEWDALAAAGLPSMAGHTAPSNRPHVTLMVRPQIADLPVDALEDRLPLPATLGPPLVFGTEQRRILARSVICSPELIAFHHDLHRIVGSGDDAAHTRPREWTPHVTLARRLRSADLPAALDVVGGTIPARAVGLRRWDAATATVTMLATAGDR
ncbi:2'-5' RNA ligase family protein [Microbacter sp. GSS18]|nr:2'-5' RNA ligase family protein [Microbacter sp. GSS18]